MENLADSQNNLCWGPNWFVRDAEFKKNKT